MVRTSVLLAALLLGAGCASELVLDQDGAVAVVPHQFSETGHIVVETMLNGRGPFRFALDTAASISVVYEGARADAGIEPIPGERVRILGLTASGAFPVADVRGIAVGSETWDEARVALLPDDTTETTRLDGLLGVDFLSRYAVLYSRRDGVIHLYPRELVKERSYLGWTTIPLFDLRISDGTLTMPAFDLFIDTIRITTLLDLGSNANLMNRRAARLLDIPLARSRGRAELEGAFGQPVVLAELIAWQLQVAGVHWQKRKFLIGDFPIFEALEIERQPAAIAGISLFGDRDFIVDFAGKRLLVRSR